jgi:predicted methyltransferase/DNA-directed RNA polymerase subunit RPC12/RpoP
MTEEIAAPTDESGAALLERVARAARLREGPEGVAALLRALVRHGPLVLREAAHHARLPLPVATALRRELEKAGILARGPRLALAEAGERFVRETLGLGSRLDPTCTRCEGSGVVLPPELAPVLARFRAHIAENPTVDVTLDQAPCDAETAFARALYMHRAGAVEGRAMLFLGDDDQISVAVALLGQAVGSAEGGSFARRLLALDIDPRRLERIAAIAASDGLAIETRLYDARHPLPDALAGQFQTVETDPPYTLPGAHLFAARAIEALAPGLGRNLFLSFAEPPPEDALALQQALLALGLAFAEIKPGFNRYEGAGILGSRSQLVHLRTSGAAASPLAGQAFEGAIFTGELRVTTRLYRCTTCSLELEVGQRAAIKTIEALKAKGCPRCGNDRFRLLGRTG